MGLTLARRGLLNPPAAIFRVDAGPGIGLGHFMRCRTLALEMLRRGWVVNFVGNGFPEEMLKYRRASSIINCFPFKTQPESSQDMKGFIELLRQRFSGRIDFIIVDSYRFRREDYAMLQLFANRIPVAVINDLAEHDTPAQVVINPNPLFSPEPYQRQKIPCILCGERYTLVRPEIKALRDHDYDPKGPILVSLGGGDVVAPMLKVLAALPESLAGKILVSVSENCPLDELQKWQNENRERRQLNTCSEKFPELLASASVAITGGGGTLWEVYCLGRPSISIVWVDNQKNAGHIIKEQATSFLVDLIGNINKGLQSEILENGLQTIVETFGEPGQTRKTYEDGFRTAEVISQKETSLALEGAEEIDRRFFFKAISRLTSDCGFPFEMIKKQRQLIDGSGPERVVEALEQQKWQQVPLLSSDYRRSYEDW